jgi:hypothetical protein
MLCSLRLWGRLMIHLPIRALIGFSSLAILILLQSSAAFAESSIGASEPVWLEHSKFVVSIIGLLGAAIAFVVGLNQYRRAQEWKRAEFLANEIKELLADRKATNALTMIDWGARRIRLDPEGQPTVVTYAMQSKALLPHTFVELSAGAPIESSESSIDEATLGKFSPDEALIRDCYDALLDRLDRLGSYLETGLLLPSEMRPYLRYYIDDLAAQAGNPTQALWNVTLFTYVHVYHFSGIPTLFKKFGHDISPDGSIFQGFVNEVDNAHQELARDLAELATEHWKSAATLGSRQ